MWAVKHRLEAESKEKLIPLHSEVSGNRYDLWPEMPRKSFEQLQSFEPQRPGNRSTYSCTPAEQIRIASRRRRVKVTALKLHEF